MATTKKGFMQPVLDRNKKIKANPGPLRAIKQTNNPLTPKPFQKAVKSIKQAVGKAAGKGVATSIAKATAAAAAAANKKKLDAAKKKAAEDATKKKAAAAAEAARKKAAIAKQKALADAAKEKAAQAGAKEKASSEPIKMSIKPVSGMTVSASPKPSVESTVNSLGKDGEIQKKLDQAAMSNMQEGKASMRRGGAMKKMKYGGSSKRLMKTGGMTNPNSSISVLKAAGSKGVRSGVNPKASSSKVAGSKGSGRVNTPPSKAVPTAKRGGMVKKKR